MNKRKLLTLLILLSAIIISLEIDPFLQAGHAQTLREIRLTSVEVNLLPAFNQPSMLVIHDIELDPNIPLPREVIFQVPGDARVIRVANQEGENRSITRETEEIQVGQWKDIRFTTTTHAIRIEYTDPNLAQENDQRLFEYEWLSIYPVDSLTLIVQQPIGASAITTDPPLNKTVDEDTGVEYYSANVGRLLASEIFSLTLVYTEAPGDIAFLASQVEAKMPVTDTTPGRSPSPLSVVMWLLTVAIFVLIMVGLYFWWFRINFQNNHDRVVQGVGIMNPEKQAIFCHECGMRSTPGDSYCSNCGTELRKPTEFVNPPKA